MPAADATTIGICGHFATGCPTLIAHTLPVSLNNVGGVFVGACSVLMGNFWDAHSTETLLESDISQHGLKTKCIR